MAIIKYFSIKFLYQMFYIENCMNTERQEVLS